jgi:hypothetical protein
MSLANKRKAEGKREREKKRKIRGKPKTCLSADIWWLISVQSSAVV